MYAFALMNLLIGVSKSLKNKTLSVKYTTVKGDKNNLQEFELWLDESGTFLMDDQISNGKNPSIIGGILMPIGALSNDRLRQLADPNGSGASHAMEMSYSEAQQIVPAALEEICNAGGKLVYFENAERIYYHHNRDLYLRTLASGLAQLTKVLAVQCDFMLNIIIAVRYWPDEDNPEILNEITPDEYRQQLKHYIAREYDDAHFSLPPQDRIALTILSARQEVRLSLADYASNARLVLNTKKFAPVKNRLIPLIESGYQFTVTAQSTEVFIRSLLSRGDISGALIELFSSRNSQKKKQLFTEIMDKFSTLSYRLQRLQIRSFASALRVAAGKEIDFEHSEALLKAGIHDFFGAVEQRGIDVQTDESLFSLNLSLADMYLREGDILHAAPVMDQLEKLVSKMNYRVENLVFLYLFREKKALFQINSMQYSKAVETMSATIRTMESLLSVLDADPLINSFFGSADSVCSEYLGDAYCMKIYAELFLQRNDHSLFEKCLREDTESALKQYRYPGELERNQQYRSKAENEEGKCLKALEWLLKTQQIEIATNGLASACQQYLEAAQQEDLISRTYYAMYYIEIMENAQRLGQTDLSSVMEAALVKEKSLLKELMTQEKQQTILSDTGKDTVVFSDIFTEDQQRNYHPLEIVLWKYAAYLYRIGAKNAAERYFARAIYVCDENPDYTVLKHVALAILLEWRSLREMEGEKIDQINTRLLQRSSFLLETPGLPAEMCQYAFEVKNCADHSDENSAKRAYSLSRVIAY